MGQSIVKCAKDSDLYLIYSTVVDDFVWVGDPHEGLSAHLLVRLELIEQDRGPA